MTAPEPTPTAEHIDAVARSITVTSRDGNGRRVVSKDASLSVARLQARTLLASTDPAVHAAILAALVRAGVLTPEDAPIARHGGYEHTHWQQRWDGQHTHEGRRLVTPWEVAP